LRSSAPSYVSTTQQTDNPIPSADPERQRIANALGKPEYKTFRSRLSRRLNTQKGGGETRMHTPPAHHPSSIPTHRRYPDDHAPDPRHPKGTPMTIRTKLLILTILAGATTMGVGAFGYFTTTAVVLDSEQIIDQSIIEPQHALGALRSRFDVATIELLNADRDAYQATLALAEGLSGRDTDEVVAAFDENAKQVNDRVALAIESAGDEVPAGYRARFNTAYQTWLDHSDTVLTNITSSQQTEPAQYRALIDSFEHVRGLIDELSESFETSLARIRTQADELITNAHAQADALADRAHTRQAWALAAAIGAVIALAALAFPLVIGVTRRLNRLAAAMNEIAGGDADLTARIDDQGSDEIASLAGSFDAVAARLEGFVDRVRRVAGSMEASTSGVSRVADETSKRIVEQNASVHRVSAAVAELSSTTDEVAGNCQSATNAAGEARAVSDEGHNVVNSTSDAINQAQSSFELTVTSVERLGERVSRITSMITVINEIAEQTNLLALNAAIEAARAGENGRGFAVVADEVRKLADRTTTATDEIVESIREIESMTRESVTSLEGGRASMTSGAQWASSAAEALQHIQSSTNALAKQITDISNATREQAQATSEIAQQTETMTMTASAIESDTQGLRAQVDDLCKAQQDLEDLVAAFRTNDAHATNA
jgi:methyl-accepting chemotaxis protein